MAVAKVAGAPNRNILLKALLPIFFLASSGFPALANLSGFMAHT